jgi:hypothetical protein
MLGLKTKPASRTASPPARRWRNYYRVYRVLNIWRLGQVFPGIHAGPDVFPSQESAEQHALTFVAAINPPEYVKQGRFIMDHAGAYPEGDRAN